MASLSGLIGLTGRWRGTYRLTVEPGTPTRESQSTAVVAPVAGGRFARIDYTWGDRDKPNDGSILFGRDRTRGVVTALWVDSWHMSDSVMTCEGAGDSLDGGPLRRRGGVHLFLRAFRGSLVEPQPLSPSFRPSYRRGSVMQALLAAVGLVAGLLAWTWSRDVEILVAGLLLGSRSRSRCS